jgi:hypothetical protein
LCGVLGQSLRGLSDFGGWRCRLWTPLWFLWSWRGFGGFGKCCRRSKTFHTHDGRAATIVSSVFVDRLPWRMCCRLLWCRIGLEPQLARDKFEWDARFSRWRGYILQITFQLGSGRGERGSWNGIHSLMLFLIATGEEEGVKEL